MSVEARILARDIISGALAALWLVGSGRDDVETLVHAGPLRERLLGLDDAQRDELRGLVGGVWSSGVLRLVPGMCAANVAIPVGTPVDVPAAQRMVALEGAVLVVDQPRLAAMLTGDPQRQRCELVVGPGAFHAVILRAVH